MKSKLQSLLSLFIFIATGTYLINYFFHFELLQLTYGTIAFILLLFSITSITLSNRIVTVVLLATGFLLFFMNKRPIHEVVYAFGYNMNLLSLFVYMPFIAVYLSTAHYLDALRYKVQQLEKKGINHPYRSASIMTLMIGSVLNLGSMAVVYRIVEYSFRGFSRKRLGLIIVRTFGACMLWSPYFVNIGLVLILYNLSWGSIGKIAIIFSGMYMLLIGLFFKQATFKDDEIVTRKESEDDSQMTSIAPLVLFGLMLLSVSFLLDSVLEANMLTIVSLMAIFFPLIWSVFARNLRYFIQDAISFMKGTFQRLKNEIAIFVSAGFFGGALSLTNIGTVVSEAIHYFSGGHIYIMSTLVMVFAITLALLGIHPVVIIIGIGSSLSPDIFGVTKDYMALLLIVSWMLATQMSPFSGSMMMITNIINESPWVIVRKNIPFVFTALIIFSVTLFGLNYFQWL